MAFCFTHQVPCLQPQLITHKIHTICEPYCGSLGSSNPLCVHRSSRFNDWFFLLVDNSSHFNLTEIQMCRVSPMDYFSTSTSSSSTPVHPSPEDCIKILQILGDSPQKQSDMMPFKRRRVHFASEPLIISSSGECMQDFASQLWYKRSEINEFKLEARQLVLATTSPKSFLKDDSLRGLESSTLERRLHRHKTIQCTLSAYKKNMNTDDVAKIARICATWNTEIAFVQACRDYYTVYPPHELQQIKVPKVSSKPPAFPFALRRAKSRTIPTFQEHDQRRVRRRVA